MGRRIYSDRERYDISKNDCGEGNNKCHQKTITDHLVHRKVVCEGITHVALEQPNYPIEVLLPNGAVETILNLKEMYFGQIGSFASALEFGDIRGEIVPRRKVDDGEDYHTDRDQRRDHYQNSMNQIGEHSRSVPTRE